MQSLRRFALIALISCSTAAYMACSSNDSNQDPNGGAGEGNGDGDGDGSGGLNGTGATFDLGGAGNGDGDVDTSNLGGTGSGGFGDTIIVDEETGASCDCGGVACQCSDGIDNDDDSPDGVQSVDGLDIECTGACDNDEGSFATGIPGDNRDPHQDCFFDGDSGAGNDGCKDASDPSVECQNFCAPLTPNGCDCFGCCTVTLEEGVQATVQLGGTCTDADEIDDPSKCEPCTPSDACVNECGECELCPGKDPADIPASCAPATGDGDGDGDGSGGGDGSGTGGGPNFVCDNGATACTSSSQCGADGYCQTGCCVKLILR